jgi:hypothetical protein
MRKVINVAGYPRNRIQPSWFRHAFVVWETHEVVGRRLHGTVFLLANIEDGLKLQMFYFFRQRA